MLYETLLYLLVIGVFSLVQIRERYAFAFSFVLTFFTCLVFAFFMMDWRILTDSPQIFGIGSTVGENIKLDIISSKQNYMLILPFFINTLLALGNNLIFKYEKHKKQMLSLFVFNLISFMMLICGNNFIQFMTFVFVIDILSQLLISDTNAAKRYSIYNLVADMGIFLVLSMLQGKLANLDVGNISHYYETGRHRDFIMFVLMLSLFVKFGFILFQGYWLDLKSAKFHALYFLTYLSTPMAALILFIKFYPIVVVSPSFEPLLDWAVGLSMVWGGLGAFFAPQIKEKFVYYHMLCVAFLVKLIEQASFVWNGIFSNVLICLFIFNLCLYYLHYEIDREHGKNTKSLFLVFLAFLFVAAALSLQVFALYTTQNAPWILAFEGLFLFSLAQMFALYGGKLRTQSKNQALSLRTGVVMLGAVLLLSYMSSFEIAKYGWALCFVFLFFVLCFLLPQKLNEAARLFYAKIQYIDLFELFYDKCVVRVCKNAGILAHIFIDFIFLERTLWPLVSKLNGFFINTYRHISRLGGFYYVVCSVVGFLLVVYLMVR